MISISKAVVCAALLTALVATPAAAQYNNNSQMQSFQMGWAIGEAIQRSKAAKAERKAQEKLMADADAQAQQAQEVLAHYSDMTPQQFSEARRFGYCTLHAITSQDDAMLTVVGKAAAAAGVMGEVRQAHAEMALAAATRAVAANAASPELAQAALEDSKQEAKAACVALGLI